MSKALDGRQVFANLSKSDKVEKSVEQKGKTDETTQNFSMELKIKIAN